MLSSIQVGARCVVEYPYLPLSHVSTLSFSLVHWGVRERELTMHRGALTVRHRGQKGSERERAAIRVERAHDA
jgi:hypothetical protein